MNEAGSSERIRRCPFCAEPIQSAAIKCRWCGSRLDRVPLNKVALGSFLSNLLGVPVGTVLALILGRRALRQIARAEGRERGRGWAIAGLVWAWVAFGVVGLLLLGFGVQNLNEAQERNRRASEWREQRGYVASLASAQETYFAGHGRYADSLEELATDDEPQDGVEVKLLGTDEEFCVEARSDLGSAAAWKGSAVGDQEVRVYAGERCSSLYPPGSDARLREAMRLEYAVISGGKEREKPTSTPFRVYWCWSQLESRKIEVLRKARRLLFIQEPELFNESDAERVEHLLSNYQHWRNRQWNC